MSNQLRLLIVEDLDSDALLMIRALKKGGHNPVYKRVETAESMKDALEKEPWDVILCDYRMPKFSGLEAIALLKETGIDIPLIIVSGAIGEETAAECMRMGARDFFMKGKLSRLSPAVERELHEAESRRQRKRADDELKVAWEKLYSLSSYVDSMYLVNSDCTYLFMNERHLKRFGLSLEAVVGKKYGAFHSEEDTSQFAECVGEVCEIGNEITKEHRSERDGRYFLRTFTPIIGQSADGKVSQVAVISKDITSLKQVEAEVRLNEATLTSLLNISQQKAESIQVLLDFALAEAIKLTGSRFGYIYYYNGEKKEFTLNTWSKDVMQECSIAEPQSVYHLEKTGLWGEAVRQARPIMVNDYQAPHPLKKGYPEGHAPLSKFLTLPIFHADQIVAVVAVANKESDYNESDIRQLTLMMDSVWKIADRRQAELDLIASEQRLRAAVNTTIQVMVATVEARDPYTAGHQIKSADLARAIATEMGLSQEKIEGIRIASSIHDLGKISIPAEILSKPTKLSQIEFSLIMEHSRRGYEMLRDVESPWPLAEIVYQHHERMDGSGYPRNLKGEEICIEARILAVADVVEAMASHRPYRAGLGIDAALAEIEKNRGIFYDNDVADACLRLFREKGFKLAEA